MHAHVQSQPVEPHRTQWRVYHSASKRRKGHGVASGQTARSSPALPWPEVPLLSASKQHRVQRGVLTEPSDVERANPGAIELQGKASHLSNKNLQGPSPARAESDMEMLCNVRALLSEVSWPEPVQTRVRGRR